MCVQNFDDSRDFAIRITYRISLRSSSLWEPRHPLLKVVLSIILLYRDDLKSARTKSVSFASRYFGPLALVMFRRSLRHPPE